MNSLLGALVLAQFLVLEVWTAIVLVDLPRCRGVHLAAARDVFLHGGLGKNRSFMVNGSCMVRFMDGNSGVHDLGLDHLALDDGLNVVVDVMDRVLALHGGSHGRSVLNVVRGRRALEFCCFLAERSIDVFLFPVLKCLLGYRDDIVGVLLLPILLDQHRDCVQLTSAVGLGLAGQLFDDGPGGFPCPRR